MKNSEISAVFEDIAELLKLKKDNIFKIRAYQKAARSIEELPVAAEQLVAEGRLRELPGVGEAITKKITELVTTGKLDYYEKLKSEFPEGISNLPDIPTPLPQLPATSGAEAIRYLEQAIASGEHWYIALLKAIELWTTAEETHNGRLYCYLIAGEAFDWLLLAERLCETVADGLVPEDEKAALLFHGRPPLALTVKEFKELIGNTKYHQYLNYFYGITVEEALLLAVREEVRKERQALGYTKESDAADNEAYRRIYSATKAVLLKRFRQEKGYPQSKSTTLKELKEFTYWLFKYRLAQCDRARIASDTKKALKWLNASGSPLPK